MATKKKSTKKAKKAAPAKKDDNSKIFSILTYPLFLVGLIWYLVDEDMQKNTLAKFHFKQSLVLVLAYILLQIAAGILFFIPFLTGLVWLAYVVFFIIGIVNAANGEMNELPVIGHFSEKFKF